MSQDGIPTMVPLQRGGLPFNRGATAASRLALTHLRVSDEDPHRQAKAVSEVPAVLLVDDHVSNLVSLEAILEPLGVRMDKACSGEQALRFLLREDYAVILLDVRMAGLSGFETASLIKQRERTRNVPIIFLTAYGRDDAELVTGYATGAVDFLQKPFPPEVLRSKVSVFVELFRAQQQVRRQAELLRQKEAEARDAALRAAGYIDRLRDFAARLSEAATVPQVCRALFEQGLVAAGAKAGSVNLLDAEGEALEVVDAIGYPESVLSRWRRIPMTAAMPLVESLREQQAIWVGSPEEWSARYPLTDTRGLHEAALALPLLVKGRALGAIGLSFARPRTFTEMDRAFFTALAHACAQALDRVHLTAEERRAHAVARAAAARLQMLTEASDAFDATNRDLSVLLGTITRQVAYFLGDACTLCLLSDDGTRLEVAASHSSQGEDGAPLLPGEGLSDFVLRGGRPLLVPELSQDQQRELGQGEALRSLLCVPLRAQGKVAGTLA
ncbi:GAF domain-containing protein, partial [Myxococcus sp. AM001]|nr:GAF domain-containing protein [Myxococcus sp. AM001]